jgi:hypothetical protein
MAILRTLARDVADPVGYGPRIVVHLCGDRGGWSGGAALAIGNQWPKARNLYRQWFAGELLTDAGIAFRRPALGMIQVVRVGDVLWVANLIADHEPRRNGTGSLRSGALEAGLVRVAEAARLRGASMHCPRLGCGGAGGTWREVEALLRRTVLAAGVDVFVYDWR